MKYHVDNGDRVDMPSKFYRDKAGGGVEWILVDDLHAGKDVWTPLSDPHMTIERMKGLGMLYDMPVE